MAITQDPDVVIRDFVIDGMPASGPWEPRKLDLRRLLNEHQEALIALIADAGGLALPNLLIRASDVGGGTPNAILATTSLPVPAGDAISLIALNIFEANTSSPVTVAFNGGAPLTLKTTSGNDVAVGGLVSGMVVLGYKVGSTFRLLSDQVSAAVVAAAEAAAALSEEWAEGTEPGGEGTKSAREWAEAALAAGIFNITTDPVVGDGSTLRFPLSVTPASAGNVLLTATGLVQHVGEYTVDGDELVFSVAPDVGYVGQARTIAASLQIPYAADGTVRVATLADETVSLFSGERGNINPRVKGGSTPGSATYSLQRGTYRHVGGMVHFNAEIDWTGASGTGNMYVELVDAPVCANINVPVYLQSAAITYADDRQLQGVVLAHTNEILFQTRFPGEGAIAVPMDAAGTLRISGSYPSDAYADLLFMGDSITLGVRPGVVEQDTFRHKVQNGLRWAMAHNAGIGGNNASEMEARFATAIAAASPQAVCIMAGINDFYDPLDAATFKTKLISMVNMAQTGGIAVTICSTSATLETDMIAGFGPWLTATQEVGALPGVVYVPVYEHFMSLRAAMSTPAYEAMFVDSTHIGPLGHTVVANLIQATAGACRP